MRLTNQGQRRAAALEPPDDGFEELRVEFCERLKTERLWLLGLSAALHGGTDRGRLLGELRNRAHRLSGTAAIFELSGVAALARALELAVERAAVTEGTIMPQVENSDKAMFAALHALTCVISNLDKPVRALRVHRRIQAPRRSRAMLNG